FLNFLGKWIIHMLCNNYEDETDDLDLKPSNAIAVPCIMVKIGFQLAVLTFLVLFYLQKWASYDISLFIVMAPFMIYSLIVAPVIILSIPFILWYGYHGD